MLKLGICEASQDTRLQRLWRRGLTSASLLATGPVPSPEEIDRFERLMAETCLCNGVARTTARNRFKLLNDEIEGCLRGLFAPEVRLCVQDRAASSGITAAEWFQRLCADFPNLSFTASDRVLYLIEARREQFGDTYILEPDGRPIQYIRPPFVVNLVRPAHWAYWVNRRVRARALRQWREDLAGKLHLPEDHDLPGDSSRHVRVPPFQLRRLPLLHPEVARLQDDRFWIARHSIFDPSDELADVVRTMNILNLAYFTESELRAAASAVERSLKPGGVWIVGRTIAEDPPLHDVTVCQKQPDGWRVLLRIGKGSEMEQVIKTR